MLNTVIQQNAQSGKSLSPIVCFFVKKFLYEVLNSLSLSLLTYTM